MAPQYGDHAVAAAGNAVRRDGALFMPAEATRSVLDAGPQEWEHFRGHWERLAQDRYADDRGTCRLRRYGNLSVTAATGEIRHLPHAPFVQPANSNPFYIDTDRTFEPLTDSFLSDPVFGKVLRILGQVTTALDDAPVWDVKIHLFRVVAATASKGLPAPEGRHRDGVILVSSLLIDRHNITGGESAVYDADGATLLRTTLSTPADLLLGDDRRTLHDVSPVYPVDPGLPRSPRCPRRNIRRLSRPLAAPIASSRTAHFPSPDRPRPATKT